MFRGLLEGRSPLIRHYSATGGLSEVRLLPVKFRQAYGEYEACTTKLLAKNFDQVRQSQIGFPGSGNELDAKGRADLQIMLEYMKADPTVNHVMLDGYSDNSGNRLTNRELSRRRALAVMNYLQENGLQESQITMRFHGEQYPLVPNTSVANRAKIAVSVCAWSHARASQAAPSGGYYHPGDVVVRFFGVVLLKVTVALSY